MDIKLKWDGSYLGELDPATLRFVQDKLYYITMDHQEPVLCEIVSTKNASLMCLLDQVKPLFSVNGTPAVQYSLRPNGCHWARYYSHLVIVRKYVERGQSINENTEDKPGPFASTVRRILLYREVFGIKNTTNGTIVQQTLPFNQICTQKWAQRNKVPTTLALSIKEKSIDYPRTKSVLYKNMIKRWLPEGAFGRELLSVLEVETIEELTAKVLKFSEKLQEIIERVDIDLVWLRTAISTYVTSKALDALNPDRFDPVGDSVLPAFEDFEN